MKTKKQKIANGILVAVMLVLSLFFLFPVIWMIANSFKPDAAITADMNSVSAFIPPAPGKGFFDNYKEILFNTIPPVHGKHVVLCSNHDRGWCDRQRPGRLCSGKDQVPVS
jgi:ABC-type glycerol-3-phosphate transport system permease component